MFFDSVDQIQALADQCHAAIFAVESNFKIPFKHPIIIEKSSDKKSITVEQVRQALELTSAKQQSERYIIIKSAELLNETAQNALLKELEEPRPHYHFVLFTQEPYLLLPTILSRANLYYLKRPNQLTQKPTTDDKVLDIAKSLLAATSTQLPSLADQITKRKGTTREDVLLVVSTAIELAYKSFFATNRRSFLKKIPALITLYNNLQAGGNLKLHIVADLC